MTTFPVICFSVRGAVDDELVHLLGVIERPSRVRQIMLIKIDVLGHMGELARGEVRILLLIGVPLFEERSQLIEHDQGENCNRGPEKRPPVEGVLRLRRGRRLYICFFTALGSRRGDLCGMGRALIAVGIGITGRAGTPRRVICLVVKSIGAKPICMLVGGVAVVVVIFSRAEVGVPSA